MCRNSFVDDVQAQGPHSQVDDAVQRRLTRFRLLLASLRWRVAVTPVVSTRIAGGCSRFQRLRLGQRITVLPKGLRCLLHHRRVRPAWSDLWLQLRQRKFSVLVVVAIDRVGRSLAAKTHRNVLSRLSTSACELLDAFRAYQFSQLLQGTQQ
jgi:hypothetical protein